MKIVPYTAIIGGRDPNRNDILCFNEKHFNKFSSPVMNAKVFKALPHQWVDAEVTIWMDGNVYLKVPAEKLVEELLGDNDIVLFSHPTNYRLSEEVRDIKKCRPHQECFVTEQYEHYLKLGIPDLCGILSGTTILRRHNNNTKLFNESW